MKKFTQFVLGAFAAAVLGLAGMAGAQTYYGWNPVTNLEVTHGVLVDGGAVAPVVSGTCGTRGTVTLGAYAGTIVSGAVTTCTTTLTFATAAPHGYLCTFTDLTTTADLIPQSGTISTTSCSSTAATIVAADVVKVVALGF